ncbi:hypothetical protein ADU59_18035 [Pararhizobium polonicum]|uniref:Uncharacterized protein n=1 Tax=Pararhizobium polonicum TaxID=1612624 RepID=A0A1C7NYP1_9HYPH|nr:hypothetical protein [Pararhizobium polonicum]OBZ94097.1 hypothetical protein ADU59_18035 [Pararhizobium polonicum]
MVWPVVIICILLAAVFYVRMKARADKDRREPDAGLAILDFGRAFPEEAIRAIHATVDEKAYFVRLHDGKVGFMAAHGNHFICHLIAAGKVSVDVSHARSGQGLKVHFADFSHLDGVYAFASPEIAAEVSLWLLDSFNPHSDAKAVPAG